MSSPIPTGGLHHVVLTVSDLDRSLAFYSDVLGFQTAAELPRRVLVSNGSILLGLGLPPDPAVDASGDRFDENRIGIDHISFNVDSLATMEEAARRLDERGVSRGEIKDLSEAFGIYVLAFRDPDNIQLELTAPAG